MPSVTVDQMREVDRIAMEETGPNLYQMMENAGRHLAMFAVDVLGNNWYSARVAILAGRGGNGGGGICAARHLANHGGDITLCLIDPMDLAEVTRWQFHIYQSTNGHEIPFSYIQSLKADLIIDAMIGYNLHGSPLGHTALAIEWVNQSGARIVSLDVPSGINTTAGEASSEAVMAEYTLTLGLPKIGLSSKYAGKVYLADIGIPPAIYRRVGIEYKSPFDGRHIIPLQLK